MLIWIALALSVGALLGFLLCACLVVGSDADDPARRENKDR